MRSDGREGGCAQCRHDRYRRDGGFACALDREPWMGEGASMRCGDWEPRDPYRMGDLLYGNGDTRDCHV